MDTDRHAMVIRADARAMGAVTALSTTNRRKPRLNRALSGVVTYNPDNGITRDNAVEFTPAARERTHYTRHTSQTIARIKRAQIDRALMEGMGSIHDEG